ncbi:MAG: hypothetical protein JWN72_1332 [Thermoleophilia bacterium]|nr:hypothetical protein [Thermoleophilia bacterium]
MTVTPTPTGALAAAFAPAPGSALAALQVPEWSPVATAPSTPQAPTAPPTTSGTEDATAGAGSAQPADPNKRGTLAVVGLAASVIPGVFKTVAIDRPRILLARAHAQEAGHLKQWWGNMITGVPTNDVVPITGGTVKLGGRVLTTQAWQRTYQWSNAIGTGLMVSGLVMGVPNLIDGLQQDGIEGALNTRSGRTGTFSLIGSALDIAVMGVALAATLRNPGGTGSLLTRTMGQPVFGNPAIVAAKLLLQAPVVLNEAGFFDFMNKGETRSALEVARDTPATWITAAKEFLHIGD